MKQFIKMTLAVILGVIIVSILSIFLFFGIAAAIGGTGKSEPVMPKSAVLVVDMSKFVLAEQKVESSPLDFVQGSTGKSIAIWDAIQALNAASEDPAVQFVYVKADGLAAGNSQLQEFRTALDNCRRKGKAVISFVEAPSTGSYYLASVADKVYMGAYPGATMTVMGISSRLIFLKDILDKVGVNVQLIRHGKYKSAGEMYIKNAPSPENLEQNQVMVNSIWKSYSSEIAQSRGISEEDFNSMLDNLELNFPEDFLNHGLVDGLFTREERLEKIADLAQVEDPDDVKTISFEDYITLKVKANFKAKNKLAIIYADGEIVDGNGKSEVAGDRFAEEIAKVRADSTVKAVLFRVNSPGGSVLASDKIKHEIELLKAEKPVVASYGDYAASGGYWISNSCERVFSNPVTLTGSIGVFGMVPDFSKTLKDIAHVNIVAVNSNKHSDFFSMTRPLDSEEYAYMQASIEDIYDRFVNNVAAGRNLDPEYVDSIAQGRVWTGSDALEIGLVDEIGTIEDAIHYTAALAGDEDLSAWNIVGYPKPQTSMEAFLSSFGAGEANALEGTPLEDVGNSVLNWVSSWKKGNSSAFFARMPYEIVIK